MSRRIAKTTTFSLLFDIVTLVKPNPMDDDHSPYFFDDDNFPPSYTHTHAEHIYLMRACMCASPGRCTTEEIVCISHTQMSLSCFADYGCQHARNLNVFVIPSASLVLLTVLPTAVIY